MTDGPNVRPDTHCVCEYWLDTGIINKKTKVYEVDNYQSGWVYSFPWFRVSHSTNCVKLVVSVTQIRRLLICIPCGSFKWGNSTFTPEVRCDEKVINRPPIKVTGPSQEFDITVKNIAKDTNVSSGGIKDPVNLNRDAESKGNVDSGSNDPNPEYILPTDLVRLFVQASAVGIYNPTYTSSNSTEYTKGKVTNRELYVGDLSELLKYLLENNLYVEYVKSSRNSKGGQEVWTFNVVAGPSQTNDVVNTTSSDDDKNTTESVSTTQLPSGGSTVTDTGKDDDVINRPVDDDDKN